MACETPVCAKEPAFDPFVIASADLSLQGGFQGCLCGAIVVTIVLLCFSFGGFIFRLRGNCNFTTLFFKKSSLRGSIKAFKASQD